METEAERDKEKRMGRGIGRGRHVWIDQRYGSVGEVLFAKPEKLSLSPITHMGLEEN